MLPEQSGVHVILGDSAAGTFRRVFHPGDRLAIDQDVLSCGPTRRCNDVESWCGMRRAFWSSVVPGFDWTHQAAGFGLLDERERLRKAEQITIWAATGVGEQPFIAHVLHRAEEWGVDLSKIYLVQFETRRNRSARVVGTGELKEQHMSEHPEPAVLSRSAATARTCVTFRWL